MKRLRLAFVVQRYGPEIDGGAEYECRRVAEALAPHHDVEVLTTCARDYLTWRNVYPPGVETVNGVRVRRFPVDRPRRVRAFGRYADWLYATPHTFFDEAEWVRRQGPLAPALVEWIRAHADDHDGFLFYTYLYLPTTLGLPLVAHKAVLVPTAHDERPIYLDLFRSLFRIPRGLIFQVEEERAFVEGRFHTQHLPSAVIGAGIDPVTDADAARFRRQHGLDGPLLPLRRPRRRREGLPRPRRDVPRLARAGGRAGDAGPHGNGGAQAPAPSGRPRPRLPARGREARRDGRRDGAGHALAARELLLRDPRGVVAGHTGAGDRALPRPAGPRRALGRGAPLRPGAGRLRGRAPASLLGDEPLRKTLGERGRAYVEARYRWPGITRQYLDFVEQVFGGGAA